MSAPTATVYRAYNSDDELLYVGVTGNLRERIKGHRSERPWWRAEVARVEQDSPLPRVRALASERTQIKALNPRYNERRWFRDAGTISYSFRGEARVMARFREIADKRGHTFSEEMRLMIDRYLSVEREAA